MAVIIPSFVRNKNRNIDRYFLPGEIIHRNEIIVSIYGPTLCVFIIMNGLLYIRVLLQTISDTSTSNILSTDLFFNILIF